MRLLLFLIIVISVSYCFQVVWRRCSSLRYLRFLRLVCGVDNAAIYNFPSAIPGLFFLGEEDLVEPAVFAVSAQVHVGVYSRNNARLAVLPDGVLALPVDFGLAA